MSRTEKSAADSGRLRAALALVLRRYARQVRARPWLAAAGLLLPGLGNIFVLYVPPLAMAHLLGLLARGRDPRAGELVPSVALLFCAWLGGEALWRLASFAVQRDSESEAHIQQALWAVMKDRTAIVIAHRLSTVRRMDRLVVLDAGCIVEQGTHAELPARGGHCAALWEHQSGGFLSPELAQTA